MKESLFPKHLLKTSTDDRVNYFNQFVIQHPLFDNVLNDLIDAIASQEKEPLVFVFGPSGVGKTTLKKTLEKKLVTDSLPTLEKDLEKIPFASVEAVASGFGNFRWKDYYVRALTALKEPLIDKKILYADECGLSTHGARGSTAALRRALEKTLGYRRPSVFIIDEAQHLAKIVTGSKIEDQLDCIKSLANLTGVKHVLLGTYGLLSFRNKSAQLNNRSKDINFRRYDARIKEDRKAFKSIVRTFELYLPLSEIPDLVQHWMFLMERTVGCIGTLKLWLTRALRIALIDKSNTITAEHLNKTAPSIEKAFKMAEEALKGEASLIDDEKRKEALLILLGMALEDEQTPKGTKKQINKNKKKGVWRPGKKKPKRSPVGENSEQESKLDAA